MWPMKTACSGQNVRPKGWGVHGGEFYLLRGRKSRAVGVRTMRAVMDMALPARVYVEQIKLLYRNLPVGMFATQASAFVILAVQWAVIDHGVLLAWFATATLSVLSRMTLFAAYRRAHLTQANARRWVVWFTSGTVLAGIIWGSA